MQSLYNFITRDKAIFRFYTCGKKSDGNQILTYGHTSNLLC